MIVLFAQLGHASKSPHTRTPLHESHLHSQSQHFTKSYTMHTCTLGGRSLKSLKNPCQVVAQTGGPRLRSPSSAPSHNSGATHPCTPYTSSGGRPLPAPSPKTKTTRFPSCSLAQGWAHHLMRPPSIAAAILVHTLLLCWMSEVAC